MKRFRLVHTTEYRFETEAWGLKLTARLKPLEMKTQQCAYFQVVTRPSIDRQTRLMDSFGNCVLTIEMDCKLQRLMISAVSTVSVTVPPIEMNKHVLPEPDQRFYQPSELIDLTDSIAAYGQKILNPQRSAAEAAETLTRQIYSDFSFQTGTTDVHTSAGQVLKKRQGVCQDFSHLAIALLRSQGFAARYVSGYVHTAAFRGKKHRIASDASHAWFEVFDPNLGWKGFDPTNGRCVDDHYIIVARGTDYNDVRPLQGCYAGGGAHTLHVSVDVQQMK